MKGVEKHIIKRDGRLVPFDRNLLKKSLQQAGSSSGVSEEIINQIYQGLKDGETTDNVYKKAFSLLGMLEKPTAIRYSLRRALVGLGPTGFPFEKFIAKLFSQLGYKTKNNINLRGHCTTHEIDVYAIKKEKVAMEVKFQNDPQGRLDLKVILYIKARFDDIKKRGIHQMWHKELVDRCILVTNGKFTSNVIKYAECAGVPLLGWSYPYDNNLQTIITKINAHPITCLPSLSKQSAKLLFDMNITTCKEFIEKIDSLQHSAIQKIDVLVSEANMLCRPENRI